MQQVIDLAVLSAKSGGGPFAAAIVKDNEIVSLEHNSVHIDTDPSAHAEVNAIRKACQVLNTFDLAGYEIYTSCEPCPMCFGAIYWAHLSKVYYAANRHEAAVAGFDDNAIYREIALPNHQRSVLFEHVQHPDSLKAFTIWDSLENKIRY